MIGRLALALGMFLKFCPCSDGTPAFQGTCHVDSDMSGSTGPEPYVVWATPRVPVGAPTLEIRGQKFGDDPAALSITIGTGGVDPAIQSIEIQPADSDAERILVARLSWPEAASVTLGPAKIAVTHRTTGRSLERQIQIARPSFQSGTSSGTLQSSAIWQYLGKIAGMNTLFFLDSQNTLNSIGYRAGTAAPFTTVTPRLTGFPLTVATPAVLLENSTSTEVVSATNNKKIVPCIFDKLQMKYDCSDVNPFGTPTWTVAQAIAAGPMDDKRELIVLDADQNLHSCLYQRKSDSMDMGVAMNPPCSVVTGFAEDAQTLAVVPKGTGPQVGIVALGQSGKLFLAQNNASDIFTDQTATLGAAAAVPWQAIAVGDVDGAKGVDIVAVGATGITTWLNQGDGTFAPALTKAAFAVSQVMLGDVDGDAKPDLILTPSAGSGLLVVLNLSDASYGSGRFSSPAAMLDSNSLPLVIPGGSLKTFDDGQANGASRRLLVTNGTTVTPWNNTTTKP